jgi:hypothetical protein
VDGHDGLGWLIASAVAMKVWLGQMTSSPAPTPQAHRAIRMASVPLPTPMACLAAQ